MSLTLTEAETDQSGALSLKMLPLLEEGAPDWLAGLAERILPRIARLMPIHVLPGTTASTPTARRIEDVSTFPLVVRRDELLVIVPFGVAPHPRLSGSIYLQLLFGRSLEDDLSTLTRPQPALTELIPLSQLGGWSGSSQASIQEQVVVCPGWDREITVAGPVGVLRHPLRTSAFFDPQRVQWMHQAFRTPSLSSMDAELYVTYLTRTLAKTLSAMAQFQRSLRSMNV